MNTTLIAIACVIVAGVVGFLTYKHRADSKRLAEIRNMNRELWKRILAGRDIQAKRAAVEQVDRAALDQLNDAEHEAKTKAVLERVKKWPSE